MEIGDCTDPNKRIKKMDKKLIVSIEKLIREYSDDPASRDRIITSVSKEDAFNFILYADYAATYAVRFGSPELIRQGILSLAIENSTFDYRDTITRLVLLNYSATKLGLDPDKIFRELKSLVSQRFAKSLENFIERSPEDRALSTFGYQEEYAPLFTFARVPINPQTSSGLRSRMRRKLRKFIPFL